MKNDQDIITMIYTNWNISCDIWNPQQKVSEGSMARFHTTYPEAYKVFLKKLEASFQKNPLPFIENNEDNISYAFICIPDGKIAILGPFSGSQVPSEVAARFFYQNHIKEKDASIPKLNGTAICPMLSIVCYLFTGVYYSADEIMEYNYPSIKDIDELTLYQLDNELEERQHLSYEYENAWLDSVEKGTVGDLPANLEQMTPSEKEVGLLAKGDHRRQSEYTCVVGITLATRAAMRGGVPPYEAYALSDVYLQQLALCKSTTEIDILFAKALTAINDLVKKNKSIARQNPYVEQCKDYIGRHLHTSYSIKELAEYLGISNAYLSRLFSQVTGTTLHQYILDTRLSAAANLLRVAPSSIGEISEYLCFCSPSYFGNCFQKKYGMSPLQYRNKYRVINGVDPIRRV